MEYDQWKLNNPYTDKSECEHCENAFDDDDINEVSYRDADRSLITTWICIRCEEKQFWI